MCSLGHHDSPDKPVRQPRRHLDNTARRAIAKTPRSEVEKCRAAKTAQLRAEVQAQEADALAEQYGISDQLELIPADMPVCRPLPVRGRLPDPGSLYYSAASEP